MFPKSKLRQMATQGKPLYLQRGTGILTVLILCVSVASCKKFVTVSPDTTLITTDAVFSDDVSATSAIKGMYSQMAASNFASGNNYSVTSLAGLSADELKSYSSTNLEFYSNAITTTNTTLNSSLWLAPYNIIYEANKAIEGLGQSKAVSANLSRQLVGEAKFVRAFCYFYLVNLFGDVPLILSTDYRTNALAPRDSVSKVYAQMISDLKDARGLLSEDYSFSGGERVRPNKYAATALLARVYLYQGDWVNAEAMASEVIAKTPVYGLPALDQVFKANSSEAIWQLMPVAPGFNTNEGKYFILRSKPVNYALSDYVRAAFETADARKNAWVDSITNSGLTYYFPYKYQVYEGSTLTEYSMVLRLAEVYLIRAEARAGQNKIDSAAADLNALRTRAQLPATTASSQAEMRTAILHERQVELFTEWGHRWLDLKRTDQANTVLAPIKSGWKPTAVLYPIPQTERDANINLSQNKGY